MRKNILPEFQEYLRSKSLVNEKYIPFYAHWASKFMLHSEDYGHLSQDLQIQKFLDYLRDQQNTSDWQVRQADNAVTLYINQFQTKGNPSFPRSSKPASGSSKIIEEMREALRIKHYAYRTELKYIEWAEDFYSYMKNIKKKKPDSNLGSSDVRDYLSHLALKRRVAASTQNQAFNALIFLFRHVLKVDLQGLNKAVRAKRGQKLPVVFTVEEVKKIFQCLKRENLLIMKVIYGAGLRLMELARLRVKDIDFGSRLIIVRNAKGDKDRSTLLPESVTPELKQHLENVKKIHEDDLSSGYGEVYLPNALARKYPNAAKQWHWQYVFPSSNLSVDPRSGKARRHHKSERAIRNAMSSALKQTGIAKHASVHTLRHSFATHLLMKGVNIRMIQQLLGHKNLETTMIYLHVMKELSGAPDSPLDSLSEDSEEDT